MSNDQSTSKTTRAQVRIPADIGQKFVWFKAMQRDRELSLSAKVVAGALFAHHNQTSGRCDPGQESLMNDTGLQLRAVNGAIRQLREGGWITAHATGRTNQYVLNMTRAEVEEAGDIRTTVRSSYARRCAADTHDGAQQIRIPMRTNYEEKSQEKSQPNYGPVERGIPAEEKQPAPALIGANAPDLPKAANDDVPAKMVVVGGVEIPAAQITEWRTNFVELPVDSEMFGIAKWTVSKNVPPEKRIAVIESSLSKKNTAAYATRMKAEGEVRMAITKGDACLITGKTPPRGEVCRHQIGVRERVIAFDGKLFRVSRGGIDMLKSQFPEIDPEAALRAFDAQAGRYQSREEMRAAIGPWMSERHRDVQARMAA